MNRLARGSLALGGAFTTALLATNLLTRDVLDKVAIESVLSGVRREEILTACTKEVMNPISDRELLRIRGANLIPAVQACTHQRQIDEIRTITGRGQLAKMFHMDTNNAPLVGALTLGLAGLALRRARTTVQP